MTETADEKFNRALHEVVGAVVDGGRDLFRDYVARGYDRDQAAEKAATEVLRLYELARRML